MKIFEVKVKYQSGLNNTTKRIIVLADNQFEAVERAYSRGLVEGKPAFMVQPDRTQYTIEKKRKQRKKAFAN